jgi:hypothetical protein
MSRTLAIRGTEGDREVDYSALPLKEIQRRIKGYEKKYATYGKFLRAYDCESSPPKDYLTLIEWECLLNESKSRKRSGLSLVKGSKLKAGKCLT